jgi:hypothetical protein
LDQAVHSFIDMQAAVAHSAEVHMDLLITGSKLSISHMGPDFIRLRNPAEHVPSEGEIVLIIDGHEERWPVHLPEGLRLDHGRIPVKRLLSSQ